MSALSVLSRIAGLAPYVPGMSIEEIRQKYHLAQVIKLASNENPLGAPPLAQQAVQRHAGMAFRYPQGGNPRLAQALARRHGVEVSRIIVGNGSDEIIDLLIRVLAREGEHSVVCFAPCFSMYPIQARIAGVNLRRQPLEPDFSHHMDRLLAQVGPDTRLVFITTPDNPTGYCPPREAVAGLARELAGRAPGCLLVIDEAYMDFAGDDDGGEARFSLLASGELPENTAFLRTFSKSFGLAGLRVGYAVLPPELAGYVWRARLPFSVNILAEEAALAALADTPFRAATLAAVRQGRQALRQGLEALGCQVWPSEANFLMFRLPGGTLPAAACFEALLRRGIIIRPLSSYELPEHLRVSVGNAVENAAFLAALGEILQSAQTGGQPA